MKSFLLSSLLFSAAWAAPSVKRQNSTVSTNSTSSGCQNGPQSRSCWGEYDINTNYYDVIPDTGVTREYWLDIQNTTLSADGFERVVLTVNGTIPGPTIHANWGDNLVIHVTNSLQNNGTSLHWHGIRQLETSDQDGVTSVTQCPIAPGDSLTYKWKAAQYGSSWYHSHWNLQAWDGVFGAINIQGPASANYDTDLGSLALTDWSHQTIDALYPAEQVSGPPTLDNILFNGTNTYQADVGKKFELNVTPGESYRLRLVNTAADNHMMFSIDNHTLTVISADFVPVEPFNVTTLPIGLGQRYDVVFTANQASKDYWIRADPQCTTVHNTGDTTAILRYDSSSTANPTTTEWAYTANCADLPINSLVPVVSLNAGVETYEDNLAVTVGPDADGINKWFINQITFNSPWKYPTTLSLAEGNETWTTQEHVLEFPNANEWVYFVITNTVANHPIHLHGHDFYVLAQSTGTFSSSTALKLNNPPRRDVAMLPANGYLVIGFITDNPGAWVMHCHISWHTLEGLALQLVERADEIPATLNHEQLNTTCNNWNAYASAFNILQTDDGI